MYNCRYGSDYRYGCGHSYYYPCAGGQPSCQNCIYGQGALSPLAFLGAVTAGIIVGIINCSAKTKGGKRLISHTRRIKNDFIRGGFKNKKG